MTLEKLKIYAEENNPGDFKEEITVLFNPNEISLTFPRRRIEEEEKILLEKAKRIFKSDSATLSLNLFFDTSLDNQENVQDYTRKIVSLTLPRIGKDKKRPPLCKIIWGITGGKDSILLANCFLETVTKKLTHFLEDGTPVRATLDCTFKEWKEPIKEKKRDNLIDHPVRIVKRGETLSSIATEEFGDPSLWRVIAKENGLINPRKLPPGKVLTIPPLKTS